jgi:hypothetical protein
MKNFTLSLYAFHLRHTLTHAPGEVVDNAEDLWKNLVKLGKTPLSFPGLEKLRNQLICYKDDGIYEPKLEQERQRYWLTKSGNPFELGTINTSKGFEIKANIQPFLLHDTYAVDLTLSPESEDISIDVDQLELFQPSNLLPNFINASVGQTLWLYGKVDKTDEECAVLAKKYAKALLAGTNFKLVEIHQRKKEQEKLLGILLFEYEATIPNQSDNPANRIHILISINNTNDANTLELANQNYDWLLSLLFYRHKTLFIYQQACKCNLTAKEFYSKLDDNMKNFPDLISDRNNRLDTLRDLLEKMPEDDIKYSLCLRNLKADYTEIDINISNYRTYLENIATTSDYPRKWDNFVRIKCKRWQDEIKSHIDFLSPGQELFAQMINTIRSIIAIDQAESDRERAEREKLAVKEQAQSDRERAEREKLAQDKQDERDLKQKQQQQKNEASIKARERGITILAVSATSASLVTSASILSAQSAPHIKWIEQQSPTKEILKSLKLEPIKLNPIDNQKNLADSVTAISFSFAIMLIFAGLTASVWFIPFAFKFLKGLFNKSGSNSPQVPGSQEKQITETSSPTNKV